MITRATQIASSFNWFESALVGMALFATSVAYFWSL
jgi:hypothetical protein